MASPSRLRYRKMAKAVRRAANRYYKRSITFFPEDARMLQMYKDDRNDLRELAGEISDGYIRGASCLIEIMDTAVYEVIPSYVYNYVYVRDCKCKS